MTAPDPRPGGCLHGPGARPGLCPNCGPVVDEAELARVAGTAGVTCECGHSLDRHVSHVGCVAADRAAYPNPCTCSQDYRKYLCTCGADVGSDDGHRAHVVEALDAAGCLVARHRGERDGGSDG